MTLQGDVAVICGNSMMGGAHPDVFITSSGRKPHLLSQRPSPDTHPHIPPLRAEKRQVHTSSYFHSVYECGQVFL